MADYVAATVAGQNFDAARVTPLMLAGQLEADSREALRLVENVDTSNSTALMYEVADVRAWSHIGLHLAAKLRGATALQTYLQTGDETEQARAVSHLEVAWEQWDEVIAVTRPLYRDMLLTYMIGRSSDLQPDATFHWEDLRPQVEADVAAARQTRASR